MASEDRAKWDARHAGATTGDAPRWIRERSGVTVCRQPGGAQRQRAEACGHAAERADVIGALDAELPREGRALDVAAGTGRLALWAARRGLAVTAVDVSPVGLAIAERTAAGEGMSIDTVAMDLEEEELPEGPFALVTCFRYRQPSLWPALKARLAPGGVLLAEVLTVTNLERHPHPSRRWLSEPGELLALAGGLEILFHGEDWFDDRHAARLVARRPR